MVAELVARLRHPQARQVQVETNGDIEQSASGRRSRSLRDEAVHTKEIANAMDQTQVGMTQTFAARLVDGDVQEQIGSIDAEEALASWARHRV
mmetsp:Transcript_20169/g.69927  ORF Transcript_20169/g.69927 Transcript_20169/m.69927 type:complete len:93 (-) Transcript_20169:65-343(-)